MSIKLQVKKTFCHLSGKVKAVDMHPTHPWVLSALYNGNAQIYNYEAQVNFRIRIFTLSQSLRTQFNPLDYRQILRSLK